MSGTLLLFQRYLERRGAPSMQHHPPSTLPPLPARMRRRRAMALLAGFASFFKRYGGECKNEEAGKAGTGSEDDEEDAGG